MHASMYTALLDIYFSQSILIASFIGVVFS
jgi:hypothetical protein